jgi:hypothetical protein
MNVRNRWLLLGVFLLVACGTQPLLAAVTVRPGVITPNGDGKDDAAEIQYQLSASANVTITLAAANGKTYMLRQNQSRSAGSFSFLFGGIVADTVLANGDYTLTVEAAGADAPGERMQSKLSIQGSDTKLAEIQNLTVSPDSFTPNRDGVNDRVTITYNLTKRSDVFVYLVGPDGRKFPVAERQFNAVKPGEPGVHTYDYEGGVDLGAMPPPDGKYAVTVEATDDAGNIVRATAPLTISEGGVPRAEIVGATGWLGPTSVPIGSSVYFTATVANIGTTPLRTKGPFSETAYDSTQNFNTLGQYEEPGVFRVGVDFEGNSTGRPYPYRWGLGKQTDLTVRTIGGQQYYYLMPGQRVVVTGAIRLVDKTQFSLVNPRFWLGLQHEQVQIVNDRIKETRITIGF